MAKGRKKKDKWEANRVYAQGATIDHEGDVFVCVSDHYSDPTNEPEVGTCWDVCWYKESFYDKIKKAISNGNVALPVHSHVNDEEWVYKIRDASANNIQLPQNMYNTSNISSFSGYSMSTSFGTSSGGSSMVNMSPEDWKQVFKRLVLDSIGIKMFSVITEEERIIVSYGNSSLIVTYNFDILSYRIIRMKGNEKEEEVTIPTENIGRLVAYLRGGHNSIKDATSTPRSDYMNNTGNTLVGYSAGYYSSEAS